MHRTLFANQNSQHQRIDERDHGKQLHVVRTFNKTFSCETALDMNLTYFMVSQWICQILIFRREWASSLSAIYIREYRFSVTLDYIQCHNILGHHQRQTGIFHILFAFKGHFSKEESTMDGTNNYDLFIHFHVGRLWSPHPQHLIHV